MSKLRHEWLMLMAELAMERLNEPSCAIYHCWLRHANETELDGREVWRRYCKLP